MNKKDKIKQLQDELDLVHEKLYDLKSKNDKNYLMDAHFDLIKDIECAINSKLEEYKKIEIFDEQPTIDDFIDVLKKFKKYINEYKKSYNI